MTTHTHGSGFSSLWHAIETGVGRLVHRFARSKRTRRARHRDMLPTRSDRRQHFGSLDDQLLNDLGLQRSEIKAAEYGIIPGRQALHQDDAAPDTEGDQAARSEPQPRT